MSPPAVGVDCLSHLGITVSDVEASTAFYIDVLGFRRLYDEVQDTWTRVGLGIGDNVLELFSRHPEPDAAAVDPFYPRVYGRPKIALTVADIDAAYDRAVAAGISPLCQIVTTSASRFFFIADPDGTPIQLQVFNGGRRRLTELFS